MKEKEKPIMMFQTLPPTMGGAAQTVFIPVGLYHLMPAVDGRVKPCSSTSLYWLGFEHLTL